VLEQVLDDLVSELFATQQGVEITDTELRDGVRQKANSLGMTVEALYAQATAGGYTKEEYEAALRHRIRQQRLERAFIAPGVSVSNARIDSDFSFVKTAGARAISYRVVDLSMFGLPPREQAARLKIADSIAEAARRGDDICAAALRSLPASSQTCESREELSLDVPRELHPLLMGRGSNVAGPIVRLGESITVVHVIRSEELSPFGTARDLVARRAHRLALERATASWLASRRREYGVSLGHAD
jgi:hypothetical protein